MFYFFTVEQTGKYDGVNAALGNGYKGDDDETLQQSIKHTDYLVMQKTGSHERRAPWQIREIRFISKANMS